MQTGSVVQARAQTEARGLSRERARAGELPWCSFFVQTAKISKRVTSDDAERDGFDVSDIHVAKCAKVHGLVMSVSPMKAATSGRLPRGA